MLGIFFVTFLFDDTLDPVEAFSNLGEGCVEWCKSQTDVIGGAEVRDDVHLFDKGAVDAVAVRVADGDVRTALGRVRWGAEGKAERGEPGFS